MRVILFGYYGYGNAGDEAVLAGLLHGLRTSGPADAEYIVLSGNPAETAALHNVEARPRNDWRIVLEEAGQADAWVFGGGSLLQDVTGPLTLPYYLGVLSLLTLRRQRIFLHGQGVGPIRGRFNQRLTAKLLQRVTRISLRDPMSAGFLGELGVPETRLHLGADLAFLLNPVELLENPPASTGTVGLSIRPWPGEDTWVPQLVLGLEKFLVSTGTHLLLVPLDDARDRPLALQIAGALPGETVSVGQAANYRERISLIGRCDMMVSMRLHGGIFAALSGVPGMLLSYDPKVDAFAEILGWDSLCVTELTASLIHERLSSGWERRQEQRLRLPEIVSDLRTHARTDLAELLEELTGAISAVGTRTR